MISLLIIEDEKDVREILEDIFKEEKDFAIYLADNGSDGLKLIEQNHPDVILLDIKLRVQMDGVELLKRIRQNHIATKVVVVTGCIEETMQKQIREIGIDAFIEKPFEPPEIVELVRKVLGKKNG